ncbi:MAG: NYN domain-containing protein [Pseudomonadota bacterium]
MSNRDHPLLAVLIDADNVPAKFAPAILEEVKSIGEPALRRVYGDWSSGQLSGWSEVIRNLGLVAHQESANTTGKNASDIGLVIDAMDILHGGRFDGFVLVSSDSDFTALANRLREDGLTVIGIGETKAPDSLRNVCNRFIIIENLLNSSPEDKNTRVDMKQAYHRLRNTIKNADTDDDWVTMSYLGSALNNAYPDFDTRTYGYGKLSTLVHALPQFETKKDTGTMMVRLKP